MADKNVIIKQKLENEIVDFYPKTKSNIVVNESNNVTGSTVTDVFNNALPIKAGEHISITPDASGIKIDFTGSLAPNVTVEAVDGNPVLVSGVTGDTSAVYTVSHFTAGPSAGYTSGNTTTSIGKGESKTIKIPQISVDKYGHVTTAADEDVTITIPSTTNMVTGTGLTDNKIILGNGNSKVKTSPYGIITSSNTTNINDDYIPTSQWIENRINKKITEGAQYLGLVNGFEYNTGRLTYQENESSPITYITPNSQGDWVRAVKQFSLPYNVNNGPGETAHVGDILIYHGKSASDMDLWDVIHTEVDTDTWRPIKVGNTTLSDSSTALTISGASGITAALSSGTLTLTGTTYSVSQNTNAKNKFTLTSSSGASTEIEINNVASAESAKEVANSLTIQLNGGTTEDNNKFTYNGSAAKPINITASAIGAAASSHDHGNITSDGKISSINDTPITSNSKIIITDDSGKIARSTIQFKANTTTKALTQAGTWETFLKANQNITINSGTKKDGSAITGTASGTAPTLGDSGITAGTYSAIQVNTKGIAIAGSQVIKYYVSSTTNDTIKGDTTLAEGGFAFVEIK